jgi:hypothetical protein
MQFPYAARGQSVVLSSATRKLDFQDERLTERSSQHPNGKSQHCAISRAPSHVTVSQNVFSRLTGPRVACRGAHGHGLEPDALRAAHRARHGAPSSHDLWRQVAGACAGRGSRTAGLAPVTGTCARPNGPPHISLGWGSRKAMRGVHGARRTAPSARRTAHSARRTAHGARRTAHGARRTAHGARRPGTAPGLAPCSCER